MANVKKNTQKKIYTKKINYKKADLSESFCSDITISDMYFAVLVRSPLQCGSISSINLPELPENVYFFDTENIPGEKFITIENINIPIFAKDEISYFGQPVGILVGENASELIEIREKIEFESDSIVLSLGTDSSDSIPENQLLAKKTIIHGEPDRIFAESSHQFEEEYTLSYNILPQERDCVIVQCNTNKNLTIYSKSLCQNYLIQSLTKVFNLDAKHFTIKKTLSDESKVNDKWQDTLLAAQVSVASFILKKTIKLVFSTEEEKNYTLNQLPASIRHRTSVDDMGIITSMDICVSLNVGAFNPCIQYVLDRIIINACGVYGVKNIKVDAYAIKTNNPPLNCYLNWGDSLAFFAVENHVNNIARKMNIDVLELKEKNFFSKTDFPYYTHSSNNLKEIVDIIVKESDFKRKDLSYKWLATAKPSATQKKIKRGIGLAVGFNGNGFFYSDVFQGKYVLEMTLDVDGSVIIKTNNLSQSIKKIWVDSVCKTLELKPEQVKFDVNQLSSSKFDTDIFENNISIMTKLLKKCCLSIQNDRFRKPLPITVQKTFSPARKKSWNKEDFTGTPYQSTTWCAAVVEVEVDMITFEPVIRNMWYCADPGEILSKNKAINTVKTSINQLVSDFVTPHSINFSESNVMFLETNEHPKEIGDSPFMVIPAAFSSALSQVLNSSIVDLPLETDSIFKILNENKRIETDGN